MKKILMIFLLLFISMFLIGCQQVNDDIENKDIDKKLSSSTEVEQKLIEVAKEQFNKIKSINPQGIFSVELQICSDKNNNRLYRMVVNGGFSGTNTYFDGSGEQFREDSWDDTYDPSVPEVDQTLQYVCEGDILYSENNDPSVE